MGLPVVGPGDIEHTHCGSPTSHFKAPGVPARIITCDGITQGGGTGLPGPGCGLSRIGDLVEAHFHGVNFIPPNPIQGPGSFLTFMSAIRASQVGDVCQCGAVVLPDDGQFCGNFKVFTEV
jgi:hypothetical protein